MSETFASFFRLRALNGVAWRFVVMQRPSLVFRLRVFLQIQLFAKLGAFYE